jgi:membrane protein DedA with SNARE-associated domain
MLNEQILQSDFIQLIRQCGDLGVFIAMFLESSIIPIPSEVIILGAGAIGIPLPSIAVFGSLGATFGAMVGYSLGRYAAMPVIIKFGKFILIKPHHIYRAEAFAKKYGVASVLIGRILPIIPFKVFSIAAGITKMPFIPFVVCTMVGVVPRIIILALFGSAIVKYKKPVLLIAFFIVLIFLALKITKIIYNGRNRKNNSGGA